MERSVDNGFLRKINFMKYQMLAVLVRSPPPQVVVYQTKFTPMYHALTTRKQQTVIRYNLFFQVNHHHHHEKR